LSIRNNSDGRLGLAEAQIQQSDFAGALPDLEAFAKSDREILLLSALLAGAFRGLGREQDAEAHREQPRRWKRRNKRNQLLAETLFLPGPPL